MLIYESQIFSKGKFIFAKFDNSIWKKLLYHDCTGNVEFKDTFDALNYYNPSFTQLYSVIGTVTNESKIGDKFEFILEYPNEKQYFQWKQTHFPTYQYGFPSNGKVDGFQMIYPESFDNFIGLARTDKNDYGCYPSLFDGSPDDWNKCVGMMKCNAACDHSNLRY